MVTYFTINMPMIYNQCPDNQTDDTCALRVYLNSAESVYRLVPSSYQLIPQTRDWKTARNAIDTMYKICAECQTKHTQQTK